MTLCNFGHDELCYEGKVCPACALILEIESLRSELRDANDEARALAQEVKTLEVNIQ